MARLRSLVGTRVEAPVAIVFDWDSWWAAEEPARPTERYRTMEQITGWYRALWRRGIACDVVASTADLDDYRVVFAPHSYVITAEAAASLRRAVERGVQLVVGPFSGAADSRGHVLTGRSPALLRELLGASGEEWCALPDGDTALETAGDWAPGGEHRATILGERLRSDGAEVLARHADGPLRACPVITRQRTGDGAAWYLGSVVSDALRDAVIDAALDAADVAGALPGVRVLPDGLEAVRRGGALFLLNRGQRPLQVDVPAGLVDLLTGEHTGGAVGIDPGEARVLSERQDR
jgi:beta-galactosidase